MSAKKKNTDFFWVSFSDLMTSLFFIMLVLFVLTVVYLRIEQKKIIAEKEELEKIVQLEEQFKPLQLDGDFYYLEACKKFVAKDLLGKEIFERNKTEILVEYIEPTLLVGRKLEKFLNKLEKNNPTFSYLLVIEGNMGNSYDLKFAKDDSFGYKKSYERALAVYNLWVANDVNFRKSNVEVLISGSGFNGLCREQNEENNKRFSIQIIPKVSNNTNYKNE
ncbi:membrane protein [Cellulophaga algicola DSM 14237]|uniref:Membrane protein n=1 Tax=Cellulophaga algicola (strain DSM 14237 / IC166 / ACAM 630) TaxID=688270 RepID=E6XEU8_CELAD|nr:membrane protein [Cellulophaga algicola]ADV48150.1 membrane protein [Cellulophaga algicola DSM 14237]